MFHSFFRFLAKSMYVSIFSISFSFIQWSAGTTKSIILQVLFFLLNIIRSSRQARIRWSVWMSKTHWSLCMSFSRRDTGLCIYYLFVWSNWNLLHNYQWILLPTQSYLVFYSFCANLRHSLIIWLLVLSISLNNLDLIFCCVLSILTLIWLDFIACFCTAIKSDSVSLLRFPFLSHVQVFLYDVAY